MSTAGPKCLSCHARYNVTTNIVIRAAVESSGPAYKGRRLIDIVSSEVTEAEWVIDGYEEKGRYHPGNL